MFPRSFGSLLNQGAASPLSESLDFMIEQECTTYSCCDYFNDDGDGDDNSWSDNNTCSSSTPNYDVYIWLKETVTPTDRMKLTDWCYAIVDRCELQRETVAIAMNIVDRFVSAPRTSLAGSQGTRPTQRRADYQLVAVTALYIAIKLNERTIFGSRDFAAASRGMYSLKDIQGMELKILHALSWRMCPPTSLQVANQTLSLMLSQDAHTNIEPGKLDLLRDEIAFQTENAVRDYYLATQRPSTVAAAVIMNAIESVCDQDCEHITEALICVIEQFPFESYAILLRVRNRLTSLVNQEEVEEIATAMLSQGTMAPFPEEESQNAGAEEEALDPSDNHIHHLVQGSLVQMPSSPRSVMYDDAWDNRSCATIIY